MSAAREEILGRVRASLGRGAAGPRAVDAAEQRIREHPLSPRPTTGWDVVERFVQRAAALSSTVERVAIFGDAPAAIARYLDAQQLPKTAVVWPAIVSLGWAGAGIDAQPRPAHGDDLVGITGAFCAVAETGTLMLLSGADTPAATSLLPETHIAIVDASRIVPQMEDAFALLRAEHGAMPRAVNFVSGPSRTADIEQTVTLGAHGPYRVHLVVVG